MNNEQEQNIPADILEAIKSSQVYTKLEKIGDRYGLLIDQIGQLDVDTRLTMLGKSKSDKFVDTIAKNLEISKQTAEKIAVDINTEIFMTLRESLRKMQEQAEKAADEEAAKPISTPTIQPDHSALEKAGDFTVIPAPASTSSPLYDSSKLKREDVLNDLENIEKLKPESAGSFVEHLLANPVVNPVLNSTPKPQQAKPASKPAPVQPPRAPGSDPYREQI